MTLNSDRFVVIGTAGHIDHGKSTLIRALTGTDPDRLPEEKQRGITIDLGFAHLDLEGWRFSFVDVPGHERFVHNMLAGATGIDALMLVVAADESVMPQTREHLGICRLLGLQRGLVALTRIDLAGPELTEVARDEVQELLQGTFLESAPIVPVSGVTGEGLDSLRAVLTETAAILPARDDGPWPRLPIDRVFTAKGFGTVVTGTLTGGGLEVGQNLLAIPGEFPCRIRGLEVHGESVPRAGSHRRVAVNLQGIDRERLVRGMVLVPQDRDVVTRILEGEVEVLAEADGELVDGQRIRLHHGTAEVMGRLRLPDPGRLAPGERGACQIRLEEPLAALPGEHFILRRFSPLVTLAGGVITDVDPPRWRRSDPAWPDRVQALAGAPGKKALLLSKIVDAGADGWPLVSGAVRIGLEPVLAAQWLQEKPLRQKTLLLGGARALSAEAEAALQKDLFSGLRQHHRDKPLEPGLPPERLRGLLAPSWNLEEFREWLHRVAEQGRLVVAPENVRLASHRTDLEGEEKDALERLLTILEAQGLAGPTEDELLTRSGLGPGAKDLLGFAWRRGALIRLRGGLVVGKGAWERLLERLRTEAEAGRTVLDVGEFKDLFGLTRKHAIPLLERLDDLGVTQRVGDQRRIRATWTAGQKGE